MLKLFALITKGYYWKIHSIVIKVILNAYGVKVGKGFYIEGVPKLKIRGQANNIVIEDQVSVLGDIDLRNRENGRIHFCKNVTVEGNCRFVAARSGLLEIGEGSIVATGAIFNGGENLIIGKKCIVGPRCSINANEHVFLRDTPVREAGFVHEPVIIEDDCWLSANVVVVKGVTLAKGSIVGAGSVVTKNTDRYSINVGAPARKIAERN